MSSAHRNRKPDYNRMNRAYEHYLAVAKYVLCEPPRDELEEEALRAFVACAMLHYSQYDIVAGFCIVICIGAETVLKSYRKHSQPTELAIANGLTPENWRHCDAEPTPDVSARLRRMRKEVPEQFWDLREMEFINLASLMLPKI